MAIERGEVIKNDLFVRPGMVLEKAKDGERIKNKNDLFVGEGMVLEKAKDGKMRLTERETEDNLQLEKEFEEDKTFEDKTFEEGETSSCCGSFDTELGEDSENDLDDEEEDCSDDDESEDEQRSNLSLLNLLTRNLAQVNPKKRQHLEIDVHHLVEEFSEDSDDNDDNDDESEDEDEQISEILNRTSGVPKTMGLMNRLLLQTSNLKL